jgi:hypothetical protein
MITKIYIQNNFTIVKTVISGDTDHIPTVDFDFEIDTNGNIDLFSRTRRGDYKRALWSDLQDEAGAPIGATLNDVEEFLTTLSQPTSGGGGGATLDDVVVELQELNASNNAINANIEDLKLINESINTFVEDLVEGQVITNTKLDTLILAVNSTSATEVQELQEIKAFVETLVAGQVVTNDLLSDISGFVDSLESLLQTLISEIDQVEELLIEIRDLVTPNVSTNTFPTGLNINVPAGFRNVTITRLSGTVSIDLGNGVFELGGGSRPRGISVEGDVYGNNTGITPAITITGGTWQWIATNLL